MKKVPQASESAILEDILQKLDDTCIQPKDFYEKLKNLVARLENSIWWQKDNLRRQKMLRRRYQQTMKALSAFKKVSEILSETFEIEEICNLAVKIFVHELNFENCSILLLDTNGKTLKLVAGYGKKDRFLQEKEKKAFNRNLRLRVGESLAGLAVQRKKPILIPNTQKCVDFKELPSPVRVKSLLVLPLFSKEKVIGVINLSHPEIEEISTNLKRVLFILSNTLGQAITIARLNHELIREQFQRTQKLASIGQLAASVAHEVNNPVTNILLRAQKIQREGSKEPRISQIAGEIVEETEKISRTINKLLDYSRENRPERKPTDVNSVIRKSLHLTEHYLSKGSGIQVSTRLSSSLPKLSLNKDEMEQVFTNLIINAARAMPEGGKLSISSRIASDPVGGECVSISFRDTGMGISRENLDKIFKPFFTTRSKEGGTGLGLSICKENVKNHKGFIEIKSKPGAGSTFTVILPVRPA